MFKEQDDILKEWLGEDFNIEQVVAAPPINRRVMRTANLSMSAWLNGLRRWSAKPDYVGSSPSADSNL